MATKRKTRSTVEKVQTTTTETTEPSVTSTRTKRRKVAEIKSESPQIISEIEHSASNNSPLSPASPNPDCVKIEETKKSIEKKPRKSSSADKKLKVSKEPKVHKCHICEKVFRGLNDLRKHLRVHSDERPYQCTHCLKRFRQGGCLKNHVASQHGTDVVYICDICGKQFPVKERLRLHLRVHTGEKPYKCKECPKSFARGGQLTQHLVSHTGIKKFLCEFCKSKFSCLANLKIHMKSHKEERDYICELCSKAFYRRDALKKHISCYHQNIKAFHCNICNKMFKGHLPQHMRTHDQIKTHGCLTCGALFSQRSQLIVHQRIHSGERPYRCQVCLQAFAHSSVLKLHIRKHTGEKPFKCQICVKSQVAFSQLPHLKKHMLAIHGKDKPYMCSDCQDFFKTKQEWLNHCNVCKNDTKKDLSIEEMINEKVKYTHVDPPMPIEKMRLMVTILLKKISTEKRLKELGYEKRLIDNVLVDSLKCAKRTICTDTDLSEADRLKTNINEFLEWTIPEDVMAKFKTERKSVEEILEKLVGSTI